jgi:gluconokinase
MGVSGSGKTTLGEALAARLGLRFVDADSLHPATNVEKMAAGIPLTDDDRWPWLDAVGAALADGPVVVACSALRRVYRDRLRAAAPDLALVHLHATRELLADRMSQRQHFMPLSLLDSQLATLEEPTPDENAVSIDASEPLEQTVDKAVEEL